jgi:hypothetical protein
VKTESPNLAHYMSLADYKPSYGDYVIWSGWLSTWHGVVSNFDPKTDELYIIFAGVPVLLFTMSDEEQEKETQKIKLLVIKNAPQGTYAIQQHDKLRNTVTWYI